MPGRRRRLAQANQAEILRSYQRDTQLIKLLNEHLQDIIVNLKLRNKLRNVSSETVIELLYFCLTHGLGNQTLGEEYTGLVPVRLKSLTVQPLNTRILVTLTECFGQSFIFKLIDYFSKWLNSPKCNFTVEAIGLFNKYLQKLKIIIPVVVLIHQGFFYITGRYPTIGKRLFKVNYAKVYGRRATPNVNWGIKYLGLIMLTQCALRLWQSEPYASTGEESAVRIAGQNKDSMMCNLCLERKSTTTTVCGHLFCWFCIVEWLQNQHHCPLCREPISPSRIVYLMNL